MHKFLIAAVIAATSATAFAQSSAEPASLPTVINLLPVMAPATVVPFVPSVPRNTGVGLHNVPLGGGGWGGGGGGGGLFGMGAGLTTVIGVGIGAAIYSANRNAKCPNSGGSGSGGSGC